MISLRDKTTLQVLTANVFVRFGNSGNGNQFVTFPFRMEKIITIANQIYFGKVKRFAPDSVPDLTDDLKPTEIIPTVRKEDSCFVWFFCFSLSL